MQRGGRPDGTQWQRFLAVGPWAATVAIGLVPWLFPGLPWLRTVVIGLFLVMALARVVVTAASVSAERQTPMVVMGMGLILFATGAVTLALAPSLTFPSPVEFVFVAAYVCFIWFLMLDANRGGVWDLRTTLETGVVAGGVVCLAVLALVLPAGSWLKLDGESLLVAMAYPIADLVLITTVLTQVLTKRRVADRRTAVLLAGLVTLAVVDMSLPLRLAGGYDFSMVQDLLWALAFAALVEATVRPVVVVTSRTGIGSIVPVSAGLCALLLLVTGESHPAWMTQVPVTMTLLLLLGLLLSSLRQAQRGLEAERLSLTDDLTGLGNRRAVMELLVGRSPQPLYMVLIDLNGFKIVNDTLGHQQGDRLLQGVAMRLHSVMGDADLIARLGGDEFAVIYRDTSPGRLTQRMESLLIEMCHPLGVAQLELTVGLSIGISFDTHGEGLGIELLRRADVAMYAAKAVGGGYQWYDPVTDNFSTENLHLVEALRAGITDGQLRMYYQPQVRADDHQLVAVEALARWQHPSRGILGPKEFLSIAREAGLMLPFSLQVLDLALTQAAAWAAAGTRLRLSLNVDTPELLSGQWVPALVAALSRYQLDPELVTVELTEEVLISDFTRATANIYELVQCGVGVSIDDFGTGYSGLTWLQTLPVTELKLDVSFVSRVMSDPRTFHIVESTIELANRLDIRVVAEGIEDDATAQALSAMGAHLLQGFAISPPLMAEALQTWSRTHA